MPNCGPEGVTETQLITTSAAPMPADAPWKPATRAAFRFCFTYFGLYVLLTQMISTLLVLPVGDIPEPGTLGWLRAIVGWVASHVFHIRGPLVIFSGSGDKPFDWVLAFCILIVSVVATIIWSAVDRRRPDYRRLHAWFRLFLRFALGSTMVLYGTGKAIPLQMPAPHLTRLLEPFGNFSPMGVLWYSIGASRPYEMFTGCAELLGGILLFVPRLVTLGALVCLANTIQIFALNMTYDVPVKLLAFHLILMSIFLAAPDARRLAQAFVLNRTVERSPVRLSRSRRAARLALIAQVGFGAYLVVMNLVGSVTGWSRFGGGAVKPPLYGIWIVDEMSVDGRTRAPLVTDNGRWRRLVFQSPTPVFAEFPTQVAFQRMDDSFVNYGAVVDTAGHAVTLSIPGDKSWSARFAFERPSADQLTLDGSMDGQQVRMRLRLFDHNGFLLLSRGFHWVQEYPFNR